MGVVIGKPRTNLCGNCSGKHFDISLIAWFVHQYVSRMHQIISYFKLETLQLVEEHLKSSEYKRPTLTVASDSIKWVPHKKQTQAKAKKPH